MVIRNKLKLDNITHKTRISSRKKSYIEPKTVKNALKSSNWLVAMQEEIDALHCNQTWTLVQRTARMNIVGSKWVLKTKLKAYGTIDRYKARLISRGFS